VGLFGLTLQFGDHGDVREAAQHSKDLIVLLLPQETQHAASVGVLEADQVLEAPNFILEKRRQIIHRPVARPNRSSSVLSLHVQTLCSYLLRDAVAEVLLLKVGQLQQWRIGLLQTLHYHLGQLHTVLYGNQSRSVETWRQWARLLCGLRLVRILFKVITSAPAKFGIVCVCVCVCVCTSSAVGHHSKLTADVDHLLQERRTLPHHKPLIWNRNIQI